jgi:hypothetical protein
LPATFIALFDPGALFGHANWGAWLTTAAGAILLTVGVLLATNRLAAREQLVAQLRPGNSARPQGRLGLIRRLTTTTLKLISVFWIVLGLVALARGANALH